MNVKRNEVRELVDFLKYSKSLLDTNANSLRIVIGNESADLDSIVCTLVYAFFLSSQSNSDVNYIPVLSLNRADFPLRLEVVALFDKLGISTENMIFLNDVPKLSMCDIKLILVDHNHELSLKNIDDKVIQIIDHHFDSSFHNSAIRNIKLVGSCCTLITEEIYYADREFLNLPFVAELLLAGVILDTVNVDLHNGRTTELDVFMSEILLEFVDDVDADKLFDFLWKAKKDIDKMETSDIFRKDFKLAFNKDQRIGVSSATTSPLKILSRDNFLASATEFMKTQNIDVLIVMFFFIDDNSVAHRRLAIVSHNRLRLEHTSNYLLTYKEKLELVDLNSDLPENLKYNVKFYSQCCNCSRKVVLPLLQEMR